MDDGGEVGDAEAELSGQHQAAADEPTATVAAVAQLELAGQCPSVASS